jgi:hypothetical protein
MTIFRILAGVALLTLGRKLFWLFVGMIGFVVGISLAGQFLRGQPDWVILIIALAAGLLGALFALLLQRLAVWLAGFIAGGYIAISLLSALGWGTDRLPWIPFIIGGIIGAVLVMVLFDWTLIVLSSLTGATVIVQETHFGRPIMVLLFVVLFAVGILIQASLMRQDRSPPDEV